MFLFLCLLLNGCAFIKWTSEKKMNVKDTGVSQKGRVLSQTVVNPINLNVYYRPKGELIKVFNVYTELIIGSSFFVQYFLDINTDNVFWKTYIIYSKERRKTIPCFKII